MALARWLVQKAQSGSGETDKDSSLLPDNEQMQLLRTEGESSNEIQLTHRTRQPDIHIPQNASQPILSFPLRTFGKNNREDLTFHGIKHSPGCIIKKVAIVYCVLLLGGR
ncbi:hypothetical protein LOD99_2251 [Oopsacas minuta]|uniref:Uncharacterized protein n=1 Tax=Oopsacas minuta TaxID=111878 RepID=A0AAV7K2P8_9METZ|nr:hypothetical protein LOD99_2251 [Oopsacas minuta]